jgi:hypothetical protein
MTRNDFPFLSQSQLDAIALHMDDAIRESVAADVAPCAPGVFLTAYLERDEIFPIDQFATATDVDVLATDVRPSQFSDVAGARDVDVRIALPSGHVDGVVTVQPNQADPLTYETSGAVDAWLSADALAAIDALDLPARDRQRTLSDVSMAAASAAQEVR